MRRYRIGLSSCLPNDWFMPGISILAPAAPLRRRLDRFIALAFLGLALAACGGGGGRSANVDPRALQIGRMKVALMPEYDDASTLVIYDGRFAQAPGYPLKTSFLIPKGAIISDACSLSHEGQHFCQLYQVKSQGAHDEISLTLPYPNFYLAFHTAERAGSAPQKAIEYVIKASHAVQSMEIDVQQPMRSSAFAVVPPEGARPPQDSAGTSLVRGFQHSLYRMENVAYGQEARVQIRYEKTDPSPSVDLKYTSMRPQQLGSAPYEAQRSAKFLVYVVFGSGALIVAALAAWFFWSRKKRGAGKT